MKVNFDTQKMTSRIEAIFHRRILNSHVEFTNEFIVELESGAVGAGSSPQGETISIYEDRTVIVDPPGIIEAIRRDQYFHVGVDQESFDSYLESKIPVFGRNNVFALSLAFYNATENTPFIDSSGGRGDGGPAFPKLCLNVLNGGRHAYTNPVLSDFPEYLLVSRGRDIADMIRDHREIQEKVKERLSSCDKTFVNGNVVNVLGADNRSCIDMLLEIVGSLKLADAYDLMIDASAGDLWSGNIYRFEVTGGPVKTSGELCDYWLELIADCNIKYLEDPFHELDFGSWMRLTASQDECWIIGDNLYSSDAGRIYDGAAGKYTHGAIVKPNQAGTVSATMRAIQAIQGSGQIAITSHRSISTESTFLSTITGMFNVDCIKIGPLGTDYSSIVRLNELIRLTGAA